MFFDSGLAASISFFSSTAYRFSQRIAVDDIGQRDLLALLAEALEGDGRLAAPMKHAKADAHIFCHEQGLDWDVYETYPEAAGPGGSGGSRGRRALCCVFSGFSSASCTTSGMDNNLLRIY